MPNLQQSNMKLLSFEDFKSVILSETSQSAEWLKAQPWDIKQFYATWLSQTYWFVCHSTRLLCLMASYMNIGADKFHLRSLDHLSEERSHERLAKRDIEKLGYSIDELPEFPTTAAFYQSQYFLIERVNPLSLFGYILYLEGLAIHAGSDIAQIAVKSYGDDTVAFLKLHSEEDASHVDKALHELQNLDIESLGHILKSFRQSKALYENMVQNVLSETVENHASAVSGF